VTSKISNGRTAATTKQRVFKLLTGESRQ